MLNSSALFSSGFRYSIRITSCVLLLGCTSIPIWGQEPSPGSAGTEANEQAALKVLNDSDWTHTVTPSLQDAACTYQNPAFPYVYPKEKAAITDGLSHTLPPDPVKADDSEYLIRFQSARPVQTAVEKLLALGEKWSAYSVQSWPVSEADGPTDVANHRYNLADMITVAVILKRPGPDGMTLFDYGYEENGRKFPSHSFQVWPCTGLRTANGQVFAHVAPVAFGLDGESKVLQLSFPRLIDGKKPLISSLHERVEFRLVVNQRVFETTFYINASDVLDGSEKTLYLPQGFTDPKGILQDQPIVNLSLTRSR
jgi:hypothetical protein